MPGGSRGLLVDCSAHSIAEHLRAVGVLYFDQLIELVDPGFRKPCTDEDPVLSVRCSPSSNPFRPLHLGKVFN